MPLQKVIFKPGVNRENTRYTTEGGWYECDKIRFRQGNPETIGGWTPQSLNTFMGICRALWNWTTLGDQNLIGVGTNLKYYVQQGGNYNDITPLRATSALGGANPFSVTGAPSTTVTVTSTTTTGVAVGDFVTFSGSTDTLGPGGTSLFNKEYQVVSIVTANSFTITTSTTVAVGSYGGAAVTAAYQISPGSVIPVPTVGWGAGSWGSGTWGVSSGLTTMRLWTHMNYGQDLVFGPRGGGIYYWQPAGYTFNRGVLLNSLGGTVTFTVASPTVVTLTTELTELTAIQFSVSSGGTLPTGISASTTYYLFNVNGLTANLLDTAGNLVNVTLAGSGTFSISLLVDVPTVQNMVFVSDTNRFVFAMGCNDYGSVNLDPMLIRWSDQNNQYEWTPDATNQAGSIRLSHGSEIVAVAQTRQEIVILTDSSVYGLQYLGPPIVWGSQILGDNISVAGPNAMIVASGVVYWMGIDKFYVYDGRLQTLNCDLRRYIFNDFNVSQRAQVYCGTSEGFNEVWWFYCSANSTSIDRYVIYNYVERCWYYGTMSRTAWLDSGLLQYPISTTYDSGTGTGRLIYHESGINDNTNGTDNAINSYISSSEFDIGDGHNFGFVWRVVPDLTFSNSTDAPGSVSPRVTMTLQGLYNSGSGVIDTASGTVTKGSSYIVTEEFTGQIFTRVRGRQMIFRIESNQVNTTWQLGAPRIDIRPDGRR